MRISTKLYYDASQNSMIRSAENAYNWQQKLASGVRLDRASDDPAAAGRAVILSTRLSRIDMYKSNQDYAKSNLSDLDTALDGMQTQLDVLNEVSVQAGNGTLNAAGYQALQSRADQAVKELTKIAQQKDSSGRPLFDNDQGLDLDVQVNLSVKILMGRTDVFGAGADLDSSELMTAAEGITTALAAGRAPSADAQNALSAARDRLTKVRTGVGLDVNTADNARDALEVYQLGVLKEKSDLIDTDIAQGVSEFSRSQSLLEVARNLFARIDSAGLFGMLK